MDSAINGAELGENSSTRQERADQLPFFLRAWWMRDFLESEGLLWTADAGVTSPLWSLYSDPLCDVGSVDQSY
ncbi:MAG: hypothetical protein JST89_17080 [Cyanobacteria bacterium SZAS-4]|nr:hypothetical protein [Cyanobacteria bacterium SZAS-4]